MAIVQKTEIEQLLFDKNKHLKAIRPTNVCVAAIT